MAANGMTIEQISTVVNQVMAQATGAQGIGNYVANSFVTVAQTALLTGYDLIMKAISQLTLQTIFSERNYSEHFPGLRVDNQAYGNAVRKLKVADSDVQNNASFELSDGESVDMYAVKLYNILQTNFYGQVTWERQLTTFRNQLDSAFTGSGQFGSFYSMILRNTDNQIKQTHESMARALITNGIAAVITEADANRVVKLITDYNADTGLTLTRQDVYKPENFPAFMAWTASRIARIRRMMTERIRLFHTNITGHETNQHTPYENQQMYLYAPVQFDLNMRALSELFNDKYISLGRNELVSYWQSPSSPENINMTPVYTTNAGAVKTADDPVNTSNVFGVIFDDDFTGYTIVNEHQNTTPMNAKGEYWNTFYKYVHRYWMDNTENAVVLLLE